jgi:hypothetical protein
MAEYLVTTELKTPWWLKLLRFFRIKNKREEFKIALDYSYYKKGDILLTGSYQKLIIL